MSRNEEYQKYLYSKEWESLRNAVMVRADGWCELCNRKAVEVHHIKYPKNLEDDNIKNLLAVCRTCHLKLHGKVKLIDYESLFRRFQADVYAFMIVGNRREELPELKDIYNKYISEIVNA